MMRIILPALLLASLAMSGCTPMGAVSVVGSTLSRTIEKEQNRKEQEPVNRRIAYTNVNLGVEYMRQGAYEKALRKFERAREADPRYPLTYNMLVKHTQHIVSQGSRPQVSADLQYAGCALPAHRRSGSGGGKF